jgi:hypothetical protein
MQRYSISAETQGANNITMNSIPTTTSCIKFSRQRDSLRLCKLSANVAQS